MTRGTFHGNDIETVYEATNGTLWLLQSPDLPLGARYPREVAEVPYDAHELEETYVPDEMIDVADAIEIEIAREVQS